MFIARGITGPMLISLICDLEMSLC